MAKFITQKNMSEIKQCEAIFNAHMKRKNKRHVSNFVIKCGCGDAGCVYFIEGPQNGTKRKKKQKKVANKI